MTRTTVVIHLGAAGLLWFSAVAAGVTSEERSPTGGPPWSGTAVGYGAPRDLSPDARRRLSIPAPEGASEVGSPLGESPWLSTAESEDTPQDTSVNRAQTIVRQDGSNGEAADTLRLADALRLAREANPMLQATRLRADVASARVPQAGALPDPQLSFGLMNRPVGDFGNTDQPMTMNSAQLMQRFPWPGRLGFAEERAERLAEAEALESEEVERRLVARVKTVYYRLAFMDRAIAVMEDTRNLLRDFLQVSSARYAVGVGLQQDVLQAQVAVAQMTEDITVMAQDRVAMAARLNALLGREATVPVGALELAPPAGPLAAADVLMEQAVERRPALQAARQRVLAAEAGYRAARRAVYPDITVSLGYGQRPQFDDFVTLMFGISIPIWAGSKQLPMRQEMKAMQSMEEARELDLYNETYAELTELRAQAERARNLSRLYATSVLPQARSAVESSLSAYRVGEVDYMTLVANEMTVNRYQIENVRLTAEYHQAIAQVEALVGGAPGGVDDE